MQVDHWTPWLEGFTEYLARIVMDDAEAERRSDGHSQVVWNTIRERVARYAPDDEIARAYFLGEVWRLEAISPVAQSLFAVQFGLRQGAGRREEVAASRRSPGIVQTVASGRHYRFMNIAIDRAEPKQEHVEAWRDIQAEYIANQPLSQVRFEGHASSPGTLMHNLELARRRAEAFYRMARNEGIREQQLIDAENPPHHGERQPTAEEIDQADVPARAFNRRVELTIRTARP
jgi:outer membrane protein OmpA-like peptidoglycan-associated protein